MPFDLQSLKKEIQPNALKERARNLNDRYTSPSSAQTGYTPSSVARPSASGKKPPPPLPPLAARRVEGSGTHAQTSPSSQAQPPALPRRDDGYNEHPHANTSNTNPRQPIQWTNLSAQDKDQFFTVLDGFFGTRPHVVSTIQGDPNAHFTASPPTLAPQTDSTPRLNR